MKEQITKLVADILSAERPISLGQFEVADLVEYTKVYSDGQFSDNKEEWYFNPSSKSLIVRGWGVYQGEDDVFTAKTFEDYVALMPRDDVHFERWTNGLRTMIYGE